MISQSHALLAWLWGLELDEWDGSLSLDPISNLIKSLGASLAAAAAKSLQSCLTLCDPIDGSPPGSPVPGILQARTLEWVAISFSNAWKWKVKVKMLSRVQLLATPWTAAYQASPPVGFSRQEYWSGLPLPSLREQWRAVFIPSGLELQNNPEFRLRALWKKIKNPELPKETLN